MQAFREYLDLFSVFFRIGAVTFGGGLAMLPILERELIKKRGWMTAEELVDYFAIGQATPGIVAVNVATFIGHKRKGILGGIVTTAGVVTPSVLVITALALFLDNFTEIQWVQRALRGINVPSSPSPCSTYPPSSSSFPRPCSGSWLNSGTGVPGVPGRPTCPIRQKITSRGLVFFLARRYY